MSAEDKLAQLLRESSFVSGLARCLLPIIASGTLSIAIRAAYAFATRTPA